MNGTILIQSAFGVLSSSVDPAKIYSEPLPSFNPLPEEFPSNPLGDSDLRDHFAGAPDHADGKIDIPNIDAPTGTGDAPGSDVASDAAVSAEAEAPVAAKTTAKSAK